MTLPTNGKDWTSLKAWANAIGVIGIPGAIAIFLVYIGATEIPKMIQKQDQQLVETRQNRDLLREHIEQTHSLIRMTQRLCSNTARTEEARQRCFDK